MHHFIAHLLSTYNLPGELEFPGEATFEQNPSEDLEVKEWHFHTNYISQLQRILPTLKQWYVLPVYIQNSNSEHKNSGGSRDKTVQGWELPTKGRGGGAESIGVHESHLLEE